MTLTQLNFELRTKEQEAIHLLQTLDLLPYQASVSFGKDSIVMLDLVRRSGISHREVYNQTGIDPPELIRFGRKNYPDVEIQKPKYSVWIGVEKKGLPRRQARWCCELLKEYSGSGYTVITGIRAAESSRRKHRSQVELNRRNSKSFVHPIFNWTEADVWEYIHAHNLPYCELYDIPGWNRIGCIMCPMQSWEKSLRDWQRYPKIADAWFRAAGRYHDRVHPKWVARGLSSAELVPTREALIWWWLTRGQVSADVVQMRAARMGLELPEEVKKPRLSLWIVPSELEL